MLNTLGVTGLVMNLQHVHYWLNGQNQNYYESRYIQQGIGTANGSPDLPIPVYRHSTQCGEK